MKKILIYGDSNTWGDNFILGKRIEDEKQWPNILQRKFGSEYKILQEGLPGRLAGNEETLKTYKNGKESFISTFRTNAPVDTLIISLGTNDLQMKYNKSSEKVIEDLLWYKKTISDMYEDIDDRKKYFNSKFPDIIYILPANFDYKVNASIIFDKNSETKRKEIIDYFQKNNLKSIFINNIPLFDDGLHYNFDGHKIMSELVFEEINNEK